MYPITRHVSTDNRSTRTLSHSIILKVYSYIRILLSKQCTNLKISGKTTR